METGLKGKALLIGGASRNMVAAVLACVLGGCATQANIADQAVKANRAVEDAHNQVLVLNVVRAYKQRPMYITAITKVGGPIGTLTPSANFSLPFGGAAISNFSFNPSFSADTAIFDVAVLDTQGFMRGFLSTLEPSTVHYYLDHGWPIHFVLMLAIREIRNPDGTSLINNPRERAQFEAFSNRLKELVFDCGLNMQAVTLDRRGASAAEAERLRSARNARPQSMFALADATKSACAQFKISTFGNREEQTASGENVFVLRSTEGILFYLGELARAQLDGTSDGDGKPYVPTTWLTRDSTQPIFVLEHSTFKPSAAIAVQHEGEWYSVPRRGDGGGRSMQALTLVSQLIGLHKDAADLPASNSVRIIGR